ncbi:hypothetical protein ACIOKD_40075 [Streptomyces sp. NPDC087844]|uniref:hypothetical protein n=1 Tax=Streptomyces sp. NPDC087844 TaxID=3365805 RepID=UPI00381FB15E
MAERTGPPAADMTSRPTGSIARHVAEFAGSTARHELADDTGPASGGPGAQRSPTLPEPPRTIPSQRYYTLVVERISVLAALGFNAPTIAQVLGREGYTMAPGRSDPISLTTVRRLLRENMPAARRQPAAVRGEGLAAHEWWLQDLAAELSMPSITLYGWARRGWVTVVRKESRPPYRLVLQADPAEAERLRARRLRADQEGLHVGTVPLPRGRGRGGAPQCPDPAASAASSAPLTPSTPTA